MSIDSIALEMINMQSDGQFKFDANRHEPFLAPLSERYARDEEMDMQKAITYIYEFKRKMDTLHPNCTNILEFIF